MLDPITTKLLAEYTVREILAQAEKDRLAKALSASHPGILSRIYAFVSNRARHLTNAPAPKPVRYSPIIKRS
jgi:hypothetical protein